MGDLLDMLVYWANRNEDFFPGQDGKPNTNAQVMREAEEEIRRLRAKVLAVETSICRSLPACAWEPSCVMAGKCLRPAWGTPARLAEVRTGHGEGAAP